MTRIKSRIESSVLKITVSHFESNLNLTHENLNHEPILTFKKPTEPNQESNLSLEKMADPKS